jgi:hypothetical protein
MGPFGTWVADASGLGAAAVIELRLDAAYEVLLARASDALSRGARDPLQTISISAASSTSRGVTRRMLAQLGYEGRQIGIIHRLMTGSVSGHWPGLLPVYLTDRCAVLSAAQRRYAWLQVRKFRLAGADEVGADTDV